MSGFRLRRRVVDALANRKPDPRDHTMGGSAHPLSGLTIMQLMVHYICLPQYI